jgi:hypothetical protein
MSCSATYYLMENKYILRLEDEINPSILSPLILENFFDQSHIILNQEKANMRVLMFRDKIVELDDWIFALYGFN